MKYLLPFICTILISCSQQTEIQDISVQKQNSTKETEHKKPSIDTSSIKNLEQKKLCQCHQTNKNISFSTDLTITNGKIDFDTLLNSDFIKVDTIKSIRIKGYDSIPENFKIFKNVETVFVGYHWLPFTGHGLEHFPRFKHLLVFAKKLDLTHNPTWLNQVETIRGEKTQIIGLKSFSQLPKLVKMKLYYSRFDHFPSDFESMRCLNHFQMSAYSGGQIDLTNIDLSLMPCLDFVQFHTWNNKINGIPKGLKTVKTVKISHTNLSVEDKAILKAHRK